MKEDKANPMLLIGRYAVVGALAGLVIGALEGIYRYRHPGLRFFLQPDVSYVIFFLGPLVDGLAGKVLGLVTGLFVISRSSRTGRRVANILGACLVAVLALEFAKNPRNVVTPLLGGRSPIHFILTLGAVILLAGAAAFIGGRILPLRTLSVVVAAAFVISLGGVGFYALRPSMHRADIAAKPAGPIGAPNIILITLDTLRADHLSLYGYPRPTTPSIDKWARQGVVFDNAIAPTSWTLSSHASIFTGLLPHQHGADFAMPLDPSWWTIGDVLRSRGYETAGFTSNLSYGEAGWGMGNGFEVYDDDVTTVRHNLGNLLVVSRLLQPLYAKYVQPDDLGRRNAGQINRDVLRWFHHRSSRPFYLFINYYDVHDPYLVPAHHDSRFGHVSPWLVDRIESVVDGDKGHPYVSAEEKESFITSYDNCLAFLDNSVGELLDSVSHLPGWENTIVIITSDHGESFGEHGTYNHALNLYREVLHVPLIIVGPAIPAGLRVSQLVPIQELFETVLQISGMDNPPFQGASLRRFWRPGYEPGDSDEFVVSELLPQAASPALISLTTPQWQYLRDAQGNEELYHWMSDPAERVNLGKSPEYQKLLKDLQIQLRATVNESLRPWRRPEYLSALGGSRRTSANAARGGSDLGAGSAHPPRLPIGTSQAFFPRRAFMATQRLSSADQELLQSLPYH